MAIVFAPVPCAMPTAEEPSLSALACQMRQQHAPGTMRVGFEVPGAAAHAFAPASGLAPQCETLLANSLATACGGDVMLAMVGCTTTLSEQNALMPVPLGIVVEQPVAFGFGGLAQSTFCDDVSVDQLADQQQLWAAYGWGEEATTSGGGRRGQGSATATIAPGCCDDDVDVAATQLTAAAVEKKGLSAEDFPPLSFARLAATSPPRPSCLADCAPAAAVGGAMLLAEDAEVCSEVLAKLGPRIETDEVLAWVLDDVAQLALAQGACRMVQRLLEVVSAEGRDALATRLCPWTVELYESPHGNHVLAKLVEALPSASLWPIVERVEQKGYLAVAKHQFGCRILERLIEYGTEAEMRRLNDDFVGSAEQLCRHRYGNFVVKHLLEHGAAHRGDEIVRRLLPTISQLAMHRTASHVVQQALRHASEEGQQAIAAGLLRGAAGKPLLEVAASRYGSYVVEDLKRLRCPRADQIVQAARERLMTAGPEQLGSAHFHRVLETFELGFVAPPGVVVPQKQDTEQ